MTRRRTRPAAKSAAKRIRVALCQLRSHPALEIAGAAILQEPFVPSSPDAPSLARLAARGLDVHPLQVHCQQVYSEWQRARIAAVLEWIQQYEPHLVLFPEGAVPVDALKQISEWSAKTGTTVLAGSHTPLRSNAALGVYEALGVTRKDVTRITTKYRATNVMPLFRAGKCDLIPKHSSSPFETSALFGSLPAVPEPKVVNLSFPDMQIAMLPLICSDALQSDTPRHDHTLAAIIAYDEKPTQFSSFIDQQIRNRHVVLFCNDGRWGGTRLGVVSDTRTSDWLRESFSTGLPPCDAVLIGDIDPDVRAVEVATAQPRRAFELVRLAEVVYSGTRSREAAAETAELRREPNPSTRAAGLRKILNRHGLGPLQRKKLERLASMDDRGSPTDAFWDALGNDCRLELLRDPTALEKDLTGKCVSTLMKQIGTPKASSPEVLSPLSAYIAECRRHAPDESDSSALAPVSAPNVVDRDDEVRRILEFLDHPALSVLEIHGLAEMGKSAALQKAFAESGLTAPTIIRLTETSSPEYILASILERGGASSLGSATPTDVLGTAAFRSALQKSPVIVIERCDQLLEWKTWRDPVTAATLQRLIDLIADTRLKLILETRHELPLELRDQAIRSRLLIRGLDGTRLAFGVRIFDAQLRRIGLSGTDVQISLKEEIVTRLGGHPKALELAADAIYESGLSDLLDSLRKRKGFILNFVSRLVAGMGLMEAEQIVLRLMGLARTPLPRSVIPAVVNFPAAEPLRNLIALGALEIAGPDTIEIAGILREHFDSDELSPQLIDRFHREAAAAYEILGQTNRRDIASLVEAEHHSLVAGLPVRTPSNLADGALATVRTFLHQQRYEEAARLLRPLLARRETPELLRVSAEVEARCGRFDLALNLAQRAFAQNRRDTYLLAELARIALTQFQDDAIHKLVEVAKSAGVEDVGLLVVEARLALRHRDYGTAERVLKVAVRRTERNPWPYYYLGRTYFLLGHLDDAIDTLVEGERFCYESEVRSRRPINAIRTQLGLAYIFEERLDLAGPIIESVLQDDPTPESIRAFAALTIKREGIEQAGEALRLLGEAKIRSAADRAQFHLLYGLFFLGIGDPVAASQEFGRAYSADRSNVFIMMKYARVLFDLATQRFAESDEAYRDYASQCAALVRRILDFDLDNHEGIRLAESLRARFGINA